jgi:hypothetical protein
MQHNVLVSSESRMTGMGHFLPPIVARTQPFERQDSGVKRTSLVASSGRNTATGKVHSSQLKNRSTHFSEWFS